MTDTKMCPYCGEDIKVEAIKCKHCQSMLSAEDDALVGVAAKKPIKKKWWPWAAVTAVAVVLLIIIVTLGIGDKDATTTSPGSTALSVETDSPKPVSEEFKPLEIKDAGYIVSNGYLYYGVIIHNPNEKLAIEFPSYRITARDNTDQVIGTYDHVLSIIYPQQDFAYGSLGFQLDQQPAKVDFIALEPRDYNISPAEMLENPTFIPLEVVGANKRGDSILGEISNPNSYDIDSLVLQ